MGRPQMRLENNRSWKVDGKLVLIAAKVHQPQTTDLHTFINLVCKEERIILHVDWSLRDNHSK